MKGSRTGRRVVLGVVKAAACESFNLRDVEDP